MRGDEYVEAGLGVEMVGRLLHLEASRLGEPRRSEPCELGMRVDAGSHRRPPERYPRELVDRGAAAADRLLDLPRVALELLSQPDWRGVLQVGAAGFDDRPELFALPFQRSLKAF